MPRSRRFPVTVTHLPITRCQICDRTLAYRPGTISQHKKTFVFAAVPGGLGVLAGAATRFGSKLCNIEWEKWSQAISVPRSDHAQ